MKTITFKISTLILAGALLTFSSCKKDEAAVTPVTDTELDATEASTSIDSNSDELTTSISELSSTESVQAISDIFTQFTDNSTSPAPRKANFKKAFEAEPLKAHYGKEYTLSGKNFDNAVIDSSKKGTTNTVVVIIPKTLKHAAGRLTIKSFVLTQVKSTDELGNPTFKDVPTTIDANLTIDGKEVASLKINAAWNKTAAEGYPTNATATLKLDAFALNAEIKEVSLTNSIDLSLTKGTKIIIGSGVSATFKSAERNGDNITAGSGYVQLVDMKIKADIPDVAAAMNIDSTATAADINKLGSVTMIKASTDQKVATLKVIDSKDANSNPTTKAVFVFKNGSERDAKAVFTNISDKVTAEVDKHTPAKK